MLEKYEIVPGKTCALKKPLILPSGGEAGG